MSRLRRCRAALEQALDEASDHVARTLTARHARQERPAFTLAQQAWGYELGLLKTFVALEVFLENAFGLFIIGEMVPGNPRPDRLTKITVSFPKVLQILRGDKDFVGWNSAHAVTERGKKWFRNGEPFTTALGAATP